MMQFCRIDLQIEAKNAGAVVLRRGFSTKICKLRRRKCAFVILETHPRNSAAVPTILLLAQRKIITTIRHFSFNQRFHRHRAPFPRRPADGRQTVVPSVKKYVF
jgi:hypothetical protein